MVGPAGEVADLKLARVLVDPLPDGASPAGLRAEFAGIVTLTPFAIYCLIAGTLSLAWTTLA